MAKTESSANRVPYKHLRVAAALGVSADDLQNELIRLRRSGGPLGMPMSYPAIAARITKGVDEREGEPTSMSWVHEQFHPRQRKAS